MTTLMGSTTAGTPAPSSSDLLLRKPFSWTEDATYVTLPMVRTHRSEALEALLQHSLSVVSRVEAELARDQHLRFAARAQEAVAAASSAASRAASTAAGVLTRSRAAKPHAVGTDRCVHPGTEALDQLQGWLNMPLDDIVAVVGLSPSTRAFWRRNPTAAVRPGKAGRLLRFRTSVGLLVGAVGAEEARHVLHDERWLEPLDEARLVALEARVRRQLAPEPPIAPAGLANLSRQQLLAAVTDRDGEVVQRQLESSRDGEFVGPVQEDDAG
ncbi:hypothetical protein GCM10009623_15440 [Nocardioides aestuarii]|uniref:DNA-binding protein n=1 Tax=Nocardioides aestuarii TaxID=252231 RepID=A0ABW4TJ59_9ACTN